MKFLWVESSTLQVCHFYSHYFALKISSQKFLKYIGEPKTVEKSMSYDVIHFLSELWFADSMQCGLVLEKKIKNSSSSFLKKGGGRGGVKPEMTNVIFFLFFFNEGFPNWVSCFILLIQVPFTIQYQFRLEVDKRSL